jgi:hypothetical protein
MRSRACITASRISGPEPATRRVATVAHGCCSGAGCDCPCHESEPDVGPSTTPRAVIKPVCRLGPLTLYRERFNVSPGDPARHVQYFVCRASHLLQAISGRLNRRLWSSG